MPAALLYLLGTIICVLAAFHVTVDSVSLFPLGVAFLGAGLTLGSYWRG